MAFSKSHLYSDMEQMLSYYAQSLAHPARPRIIMQLTDAGSLDVENLRALHPLAKPTFSQHLEILRENHLVNYSEAHPFTYYSLDPKNIERLKKELMRFLDSI